MTSIYDCYELNNGVRVPCLGFGTYKAAEDGGGQVLRMALDAGYRYFDTASFYQNEEVMGKVFGKAEIKREELFLASKAWKTQMGYREVKKAFEESLEKLKTDYLDLYLIHWPLPNPDYEDWKALDLDTWKAMEELYQDGRVRAIGVSNFLPHHLENLLEHAKVSPAVDQIEFHPGYTQEMTVEYCQKRGILVQAWSPLGRRKALENPLLRRMAQKYQVSTAQICLRYALQRGVVPLPKASSLERMKENQEIFDFALTKEDMYRIGSMAPDGWSGEHPDSEGVRE